MKTFKFVFFAVVLMSSAPMMAASIDKEAQAYPIYLKALLYESQGNLTLAMEHLEAALVLAPDSASINRELASVAIRLGLMERASIAIDRSIEIDPKNVKSYILAGQIYWASGDTDVAEARFKSAVDLAPDEAEPLMNLAMSVTAKDPERAIKLYKDYLKHHPAEVEILERVAQIHQGLGELDKAKKEWNKVLEWSPESIRANLSLAQIAEVQSDTTTAIMHYKSVLDHDPSNLPLLLRVGELQYRNNEMHEAYEVFSKARQIAPESASANFWLALLSEQRGEWDKAISLLEKVAKNAREPGVLLRLSYYYSQSGQKKKGIQVLEELSQGEPNNQDFLNYLAVAYEENGQNKNAEKVLKKLIELNPENPEAHFNLATLYDRSKKFPSAEGYFKKAIELNPDYHIALNYLGYSYADRNIKLEEAEDLVNKAVALDPTNGAYMDSMGWVYFRMGKFSKAEDFLRTATTRANDPLIWDHLAQAQVAQKFYIDGILSWEESLRLDPNQKKVRQNIQKALGQLNDADRIQLYVKKGLTYFSDLNGIKSILNVRVCVRKPCFESAAQFQYARDGEFKIEIPGPLTGPVLMLVKPHKKPIEYGTVHPVFQSAEDLVKRAFEKFHLILTADLFRITDLAELKKNAKSQGSSVVSFANGTQIRFEKKNGNLIGVKMKVSDDEEEIELKSYKKAGLNVFPHKWIWKDVKTKSTITITLTSPVVTFAPRADETPQP